MIGSAPHLCVSTVGNDLHLSVSTIGNDTHLSVSTIGNDPHLSVSTIGNLEGQWAMQGKPLTDLSVEQVVDCDGTQDQKE